MSLGILPIGGPKVFALQRVCDSLISKLTGFEQRQGHAWLFSDPMVYFTRQKSYLFTGSHHLQARSNTPGLFHGAYSYKEAARLLNVSAQRVARWADGYSFEVKYGVNSSGPILQTRRNKGAISFLEFFELLFVKEYVALSVPLPHIRSTAEALSRELGDYPFSKARLLVGGRQLLIHHSNDILQRPDIGQLIADFADALNKQVVIRGEDAARYNPEGFDGNIYLDKDIHGGEAVIEEFAIPTRSIFSLWQKERSIESVADYHEISTTSVSQAIRYEGQWRLAA
jgi:uncharacterized protein (DUF433 family)